MSDKMLSESTCHFLHARSLNSSLHLGGVQRPSTCVSPLTCQQRREKIFEPVEPAEVGENVGYELGVRLSHFGFFKGSVIAHGQGRSLISMAALQPRGPHMWHWQSRSAGGDVVFAEGVHAHAVCGRLKVTQSARGCPGACEGPSYAGLARGLLRFGAARITVLSCLEFPTWRSTALTGVYPPSRGGLLHVMILELRQLLPWFLHILLFST